VSLLRIRDVVPLRNFRLRLTLTDGSEIERDIEHLLCGPIFESIRDDPVRFGEVRAHEGALVWPNGADLCPDVVIWNGPPPDHAHPSDLLERLPVSQGAQRMGSGK